MAVRYSAAFLLHLRDSPLCTRPENLPPTEEWMGYFDRRIASFQSPSDSNRSPPPDQLRAQNKATGDRPRVNDNPLFDPSNRRPVIDRSRSSANPEDIVFGPPRTAFNSARGNKLLDADKSAKELDSHGRGGLRGRNGDTDGDRQRESRNSNLRRSDTDPDTEGWSTVKPRKSFGAEGAERFHGKMGGNFRDERRSVRDRDDRDTTRDRPTRPYDTFVRDKDTGDGETRPRNGLARNKLDTWRSGDSKDGSHPEKRDRDRTKSWRDRDRETEDDRASGRTSDRRWGRDREQRNERDPEWLDEPQVEQREAHTQQDFQKWMEQMKAAKSGNTAPAKPAATAASEAVTEVSKPAVDAGPDKFFMAFGGSGAALDVASPSEQPKDAPSKAKPSGKSSRFTSFFSQSHHDGRAVSEGSASLAVLPAHEPPPIVGPTVAPAPAPEEERQAFQQLLAKLQKQSMSATPPGPSPFAAPPQGHPVDSGKNINAPDYFQQYGRDRHDTSLGAAQPPHEILAPRPQQQPARPDQLLQDFVGHHQRVSSQGSLRTDVSSARNNSNAEFLMTLMKPAVDSQRADQQSRLPQPQKPGQMSILSEREAEYLGRENRGVPRQLRPPPPPGFPMDESFHGADQEQRQSQPTQILQRPPPGLDQIPPEWMARGGQMAPPPQRGPMMPPPGLAGGPSRNMTLPHMFPPNFPPAGMPPPPPPEAMGAIPPRNMPMPPPGFFNGPPHGFVPPGLGGFNGPPGPDSHAFGGAAFEGRGVPPSNGRGASFGRP
ncbi:hypothetical protein CP533_6770 [Ophiocordyceps camponoti-saundersi (nom. inval.)]|nr:hypothetical protein CP533_6770 [Ophiocordyceps camponoti-saundersi (nom. inval.)]